MDAVSYPNPLPRYTVIKFNETGVVILIEKNKEIHFLNAVTGKWIPQPISAEEAIVQAIDEGQISVVTTTNEISETALTLASLNEVDLANRLMVHI